MSESNEQSRKNEDNESLINGHLYTYDFSELVGSEEFRSDRNKVIIRGRVTKELRYSHSVKEYKHYKMMIKVKNKSGRREFLPVIISEWLIDEGMIGNLKGKKVEIKGQLRSYDIKAQDGMRYLQTEIFATSRIQVYGEENVLEKTTIRNQIYISGYVCMKPICRETRDGIKYTKIIAAVPSKHMKKDYITCVFWNENAQIAEKFKVGDSINVYGILRNRRLYKKHFEGSHEVDFIIFQDVSVVEFHK